MLTLPLPVNETSIRLRCSGISSQFGLITSNATTGEGIILVDTGNIPGESIRSGCGYLIRVGVPCGT